MATSPLRTSRFRNIFAACWLLWTAVQVQVLLWYGFSLATALWDSIISNITLVAVTLLVGVILQYYLPQKRRYSFILGLCAVLTLIWFFVSRAMVLLATDVATEYHYFFSQSTPVRITIGFLVIGCMCLVSMIWYLLQDQHEAEKRRMDAERLSKDAELYKLRHQLQPHFLFNSLNSITALIGSQPQQARVMVHQLAEFLRGTLKKEELVWVTLEEELEHLRLYLDIEKVRFGHRLDTVIENETSGMKLPSMLLQPIVENAIKFGLYDTTEPITIRVLATQQDNQLQLQVMNPFDPATADPKKGTGFGLSSVQRRLFLLFARNDLLQTEMQQQQFITTIKIPQQ